MYDYWMDIELESQPRELPETDLSSNHMSDGNLSFISSQEETDAEVAWEDQKRINRFSSLNVRLDEIETTIASKKEEKDSLDDTINELILSDEDELIRKDIIQPFFPD
ncbi:putative prefoldin subunit 4 [Neolecta irregularis DAH-3]|uniref:Putative prefoldin subunit 4 n=1 Tax=Neolecta irregularis (strain DAH-3) TaxID=1198029 RepID=A0A1U7LGD1_NEOID|nr:putative prefoldin subunit 4 [Neolecta irregularis DAH-3]|eukprot:OLL21707.1 putative prefoldin subunit 4 [Neolecta irregularis DAH-3]